MRTLRLNERANIDGAIIRASGAYGNGGNIRVNDAPSFIALTDDSIDATDLTTYSFTTQNFGADYIDRTMIVSVFGNSGSTGRTISSATIGGVSANVSFEEEAFGSSVHVMTAAPITGTTGTVAITFSGSMESCGIAVYSVSHLESETPVDTAFDENFSDANLTLSVISGGIAVGIAGGVDTPSEITFGGLDHDFAMTEIESGAFYRGASKQFSNTERVGVSCAVVLSADQEIAVVSFR